MPNQMQGADAAELEWLAVEFRRAADQIDRESGLLSNLLNQVDWLGNVATRFVNGWTGTSIPRMNLSTRFLREAADELMRNAADQRQASGAGSGAVLGAVTIGPVRLEDPTPISNYPGVDRTGEALFPRSPRATDAVQGGIGDCFLVAALAAIATADPNRIRELVTDNGDGTFTVHFADGDVRVDADPLPTQNAMWVAVIEKAYALRVGGYDDLNRGGWPEDVFAALLGTDSEVFDPDSSWSPPWDRGRNSNVSPDETFDRIEAALDNGQPVTAAVFGELGIETGHALTVMDVFEVDGQKYVELRNPWGVEGKMGDPIRAAGGESFSNGRMQLPIDVFADKFGYVMIGKM